MDLKQYIRNVPDFPKPGILFRDITPLLGHPEAFRHTIRLMADRFRGLRPDAILAAESRGFIFGAPLAIELNLPFVPIRKPGKLPFTTHRHDYDLEYGSDSLEIHTDAIHSGSRVLIIDDLLATGGTIQACSQLAQKIGAEIVGYGFLIELTFLNGRKHLHPCEIYSVLTYDGED